MWGGQRELMDGEVDGEGEGQDIGRRKGRTWGIDKRREGEVDGVVGLC